jgi:hypothetical protein
MKNKKGNTVVIAIIIVIVAITASALTWFVATKNQKTEHSMPPSTLPAQQSQKSSLPIVNLNKFTKEEGGEKTNHVEVEYRKSIDDKKIALDFDYEASPSMGAEYEVSYLSQNYLVITRCADLAPCSDYLFDLNKLQQVKLQFPSTFGNVLFFENEKYIAFQGIGSVAQAGFSIEMIDGEKVYCLVSDQEVSNIVLNNGVMSFTEHYLLPDELLENKGIKKINIADFCKNK